MNPKRLRARRTIRRWLKTGQLDIETVNVAAGELGLAPVVIPVEPPVKRVIPSPVNGAVYVIKGGDGLYKIGSARDANRRLGSLQTGSPVPLELVFVIPTRQSMHSALERALHHRLADKRVKGEWFNLDHADLAALSVMARAAVERPLQGQILQRL